MNEWFENRLIEEIVNQQYFATATNYAKQWNDDDKRT